MREKTITETRYICQVVFDSLDCVKKGRGEKTLCEKEINAKIEELKGKGAKIVSIVPHTFGFSPSHLIYDIIYSAETEL